MGAERSGVCTVTPLEQGLGRGDGPLVPETWLHRSLQPGPVPISKVLHFILRQVPLFGSGWRCNRGYTLSGRKVQESSVPPGAGHQAHDADACYRDPDLDLRLARACRCPPRKRTVSFPMIVEYAGGGGWGRPRTHPVPAEALSGAPSVKATEPPSAAAPKPKGPAGLSRVPPALPCPATLASLGTVPLSHSPAPPRPHFRPTLSCRFPKVFLGTHSGEPRTRQRALARSWGHNHWEDQSRQGGPPGSPSFGSPRTQGTMPSHGGWGVSLEGSPGGTTNQKGPERPRRSLTMSQASASVLSANLQDSFLCCFLFCSHPNMRYGPRAEALIQDFISSSAVSALGGPSGDRRNLRQARQPGKLNLPAPANPDLGFLHNPPPRLC